MQSAFFARTQEPSFWDFKGVKASEGVHGIARYPAVMVPEMQKVILSDIVKGNTSYKKMLDPFHGSGVTLVEAQCLGMEVTGIDINPYAHLMTKVKLSGLDAHEVSESNVRMKSEIFRNDVFPLHVFKNIDKWFRKDIIVSLSRVRNSIYSERNKKIRMFYWLCFGEIVKKYSNTRTSTFKLHVKKHDDIEAMVNDVVVDFVNKIDEYVHCIGCESAASLYCDDALKIMGMMEDESFDIVCTSPPYGDNATTVTYGQFSVLQLHWIDMEDIGCSASLLDTFSRIDRVSMGGGARGVDFDGGTPSFRAFIGKISREKQRKSCAFMGDFACAFNEMARLLKRQGCMVLTLANRRIDNVEYPLVETALELAAPVGLEVVGRSSRNIQRKRMPGRVSSVKAHGPVASMAKEVVLLLRKR